jgi:hypothetical protein
MSRAISGNTEQPILLEGGVRIWATVTGVRTARGSCCLELTFAGAASMATPPLREGLSIESGGIEKIVVRADLGSYRVRPRAGVKVVGGVSEDWSIMLFTALDPSDEEETFWYTVSADVGPIVPPPYYHLIRVVAGQVQYQTLTIAAGHPFSIAAGGADLAAITPAVVQFGFRI